MEFLDFVGKWAFGMLASKSYLLIYSPAQNYSLKRCLANSSVLKLPKMYAQNCIHTQIFTHPTLVSWQMLDFLLFGVILGCVFRLRNALFLFDLLYNASYYSPNISFANSTVLYENLDQAALLLLPKKERYCLLRSSLCLLWLHVGVLACAHDP